MVKTDAQKREDEVLLRMLKMPPKPHVEMKLKSRPVSKEIKAAE